MMKLVSVIIPAYNREGTIKKAIDSVLCQTYRFIELIVVDDCSTDRTREVVKSIKDDRIQLICCEKNSGACVARNIGVKHAKGEVIAFQDSDDIWRENKLEKSLYYLEKEKAELVFSALVRKEKVNGVLKRSVLPAYNLNHESDKIGRAMYQNCVSTQTIVAKKSVLEKVCFDPAFPRFQDWDFIIQALLKGIKVYYIDEPLVDCFIVGNSITADGKKAIKALQLLEKKYLSEYEKRPDIYRKFCEKAGYLAEMSGGNGLRYFRKEFDLQSSAFGIVKIMMARLRLYRPVNRLLGSLIEKVYKRKRYKNECGS